MDLAKAVILGIIEGITEFLPISSTGHLILTARALNIPTTEFLKSFEIAIQLGAISSVIFLYWRSLLINLEIIKRLLAAFTPTVIIGFIFYKTVKKFLLGSVNVVLWSLFIGGALLVLFELAYRERKGVTEELSGISYRQSFLIGVFQSLAIVPGVSRAAATIVGGLILGLKRKTIVEFSFLLAVPTMLAATMLDLLKSAPAFGAQELIFIGTGFVTSFIVALFSIKLLLYFIKNHNFIPFGIYRVILAAAFWAIF